MTESDHTDCVPTWRDGVILSLEERAKLTPEQWDQYSSDSMVRDLSEIEQLREPMRSWATQVVENARTRAHARIAQQERNTAP